MCWTIRIGQGKFGRSDAASRWYATTPPAEAPITMTRIAKLFPISFGHRAVVNGVQDRPAISIQTGFCILLRKFSNISHRRVLCALAGCGFIAFVRLFCRWRLFAVDGYLRPLGLSLSRYTSPFVLLCWNSTFFIIMCVSIHNFASQ